MKSQQKVFIKVGAKFLSTICSPPEKDLDLKMRVSDQKNRIQYQKVHERKTISKYLGNADTRLINICRVATFF
jgi:hypothetical protein